jgi:hypothetical protein
MQRSSKRVFQQREIPRDWKVVIPSEQITSSLSPNKDVATSKVEIPLSSHSDALSVSAASGYEATKIAAESEISGDLSEMARLKRLYETCLCPYAPHP